MPISTYDSAQDASTFAVRFARRDPAVMTNGLSIFVVSGGFIRILDLVSECVTANDGTASTLQYRVDPTLGASVTISAASASLASAAIGATVALQGDALSTAALLNASNANLGCNQRGIVVGPGTIELVIATGSTTGTWRHHIRYEPLSSGGRVSPT